MAIPIPSYDELKNLIGKALTLPEQERIIQLRETAIAYRIENADLKTEALELRQKLGELEAMLKLRAELKFENGCYWLKNRESSDGPFCQVCYDKDGKLCRLQRSGRSFHCFVCDNGFGQGSQEMAWVA
jgi:hypothetical protein